MTKRPLCTLSSLFDDLKRLDPDLRNLDRDIKTIGMRTENEGISFLTIALPAFGLAFDRGLAKRCLEHIPGFARIPGLAIPKLLSGMLSRVFDPCTGHLKDDYDMSVLKSIRQVLYLFKKFQLSSENEVALDKKAKLKFFSVDDEISQLNLCGDRVHFLKTCCQTILPNLDGEEEYRFKHGPGAVVEGHLSNSKWSAIWSALLSDVDLTGLGLDAFGLTERIALDRHDATPQVLRGLSKLISVAKNSTSRRTITIEPVVNQYLQQGLNDILRYHIAEIPRRGSKLVGDPILSNCLDLTDQSLNQDLAVDGSYHGKWATLDLSSASDRLSCEVVKIVFWNCPEFSEKLFRFRSVQARAGKTARTLTKFAGMGNATTFPVQSVVFAMISIASILHKLGLRPTHRNVQRTSKMVRVYGDDIVVPTAHHSQVEDWLEHFGMRINRHKSFTEGNFRESCGVDAFNGVEVTPLYLKFEPSDPKLDADLIARAVEFSNHCWMEGYYTLSNSILRSLEGRIKHLPLKHKDDGFVGLTNRWNARTYTNWSSDLQRPVTKGHVILARKHLDEIDGWPALLKSLTTPLIGRPVGHLKEVSRKYSTRLATRYF